MSDDVRVCHLDILDPRRGCIAESRALRDPYTMESSEEAASWRQDDLERLFMVAKYRRQFIVFRSNQAGGGAVETAVPGHCFIEFNEIPNRSVSPIEAVQVG